MSAQPCGAVLKHAGLLASWGLYEAVSRPCCHAHLLMKSLILFQLRQGFDCRLPPIETQWRSSMEKDAFLNRGFTFQCPAWHNCKLHKILLTKVSFRHLRIILAADALMKLIEPTSVLPVRYEPGARCTIQRNMKGVARMPVKIAC